MLELTLKMHLVINFFFLNNNYSLELNLIFIKGTDSYISRVFDILQERYPFQRYKGLIESNFLSVSNVVLEGISELKDQLYSIIMTENHRSKLPKLKSHLWLSVMHFIASSNYNYIYFKQFQEWARRYFNIKKVEFIEMLYFLHSNGVILYFGPTKKEELNFIVIEKTSFITTMLKFIHKNQLISMGILNRNDFTNSFQAKELQVDSVIQILEKFKILFPIPNPRVHNEKIYFVIFHIFKP